MTWRIGSTASPIGIDLDGRHFSAVQLTGDPHRRKVRSVMSYRRTGNTPVPEATAISDLCEILERRGFKNRDIVLSLPSDLLMTGTFEVPRGESEATRMATLTHELAAAYRCDEASVEVRYWDVPPCSSRAGDGVIAVGCARQAVDDLLDSFERERWNVIGVDVPAWALGRSCAPLLSQSSGPVILLILGWMSSSLVVWSQDTIVFERTLPDASFHRLQQALVNEVGLDDQIAAHALAEIGLRTDLAPNLGQEKLIDAIREKARIFLAPLTEELRSTIAYFAREFRHGEATSMLVCGEAAGIPGIAARINEDCNVPARHVTLGDVADCSTISRGDAESAALTAACGLALFPKRQKRCAA